MPQQTQLSQKTDPIVSDQLQRFVDNSPIFVDQNGHRYTACAVIFACDNGSSEIVLDRHFADLEAAPAEFFSLWVSDIYMQLRAKLCPANGTERPA